MVGLEKEKVISCVMINIHSKLPTPRSFDLICEGGATECTLPHFINGTTNEEEVFDLVHVRDVIQHLTLNQGLKYLAMFFSPVQGYLLQLLLRPM